LKRRRFSKVRHRYKNRRSDRSRDYAIRFLVDLLKRRARNAGISTAVFNHTFRATGITAYLDHRGSLENAKAMAAHESPRTTKLYDRTDGQITPDEVEKIGI
jgi:integrase